MCLFQFSSWLPVEVSDFISFQKVILFAETLKFHFNGRKMKAERLQGSHTNPLLGQEMDLSFSEHSHSHTPILFSELSFSWFNPTFYAHHVAKKKKKPKH